MGRSILMKLAPEVGLIEIFQKPSWFCSLTFSSKVTGGSHLGPPEHEKFERVTLENHKNKQATPFQ